MDIIHRVIYAVFLGTSGLCSFSDPTNDQQGPVVGYMTDNYGPRIPILIGSFLHVFGLMMTSLSKKYYQIILSQSICSALGCSFLFYARKYFAPELNVHY
jgi:MFS family permease